MLRRVPELAPERDAALHARCTELVTQVPPEIFQRALRYLYAKETRTSYAIEREPPTQQRAERFMALLHRAGSDEFLTQDGLVSPSLASEAQARSKAERRIRALF